MNLDLKFTKMFFDIINNNKYIKELPNYLGLIPYEIYVIPGMYLAILEVLWLGSPNPIQFHLLPHWFAYSIFQFLKKSFSRMRPGCRYKSLSKYIDSSHCKHGHQFQSFPSGHTGVAFALATSLFMEMMYSDNPHFFEIPIKERKTKILISVIGYFVATMISLHRISKGFHSMFDVICGALIGFAIGFVSWSVMETYKKLYRGLCKNNDTDPLCDNYNLDNKGIEFKYWINNWNMFSNKIIGIKSINILTGIVRIILTIPILYLLLKFLTKDVYKLSSIKH